MAAPSTRLPDPIDPTHRLGRRRYERRHGFLPSAGRQDLPATGRTTLYRVEWGRAGRDVCVMLARWEHRATGWQREEVAEHVWLGADDAAAIGDARLRLGARGERLEEEADAARLAGRLAPPPGPPAARGVRTQARRIPRARARRRRRWWNRPVSDSSLGVAPWLRAAAVVGQGTFMAVAALISAGAPAALLAVVPLPPIAVAVLLTRAQRRRRAAIEAARAAAAGLTVAERRGVERRLDRLARELDADDRFLEELAEDPR